MMICICITNSIKAGAPSLFNAFSTDSSIDTVSGGVRLLGLNVTATGILKGFD